MKCNRVMILPNGEVGTITKITDLLIVLELRSKPKVRRPLGMFYEKRMIIRPPYRHIIKR
jgi:hypothetical protein